MRPYAGWLNRTQTYIEFCSYYSNSSGDCELVRDEEKIVYLLACAVSHMSLFSVWWNALC